MNYKTFSPGAPLRPLVQCFWTLESDPYAPMPKDYFLMADSCPEIIFQYNGGFKNYATQSARVRLQHTVHDRFLVGSKVGFFGVRLQPHALAYFLPMPAHEVVNCVFDFADLFKPHGADLADQVYNAAGTAERIRLVADFLAKKAFVEKADPVTFLVSQVVRTEGAVAIPSLWAASGLSVKQFERRFKAIAGFSPKHFARIVRFQAAKDRYDLNASPSMTSLAYAGNYYDQSHFNREFKEFSGVPPLQYFKPAERARRFDGYLPCGWFI